MKNLLRVIFIFLLSLGVTDYADQRHLETGFHLEELCFQRAKLSDREYLIQFAISSNDIYNTRTEPVDVAWVVFDIAKQAILSGDVEVLQLGDEIVGFYALKDHENFNEGELGHLFVKAGLQGQGIGMILFRKAIQKARDKGWQRLFWLSDPDAEKFYLKMGATITDYEENLLNPGVGLPIFEYYL